MNATGTFHAAGDTHADTFHADGRADRPAAPPLLPPRRRRRTWPWLLGAVLVLAGLALLAAALGATALMSAIDPAVLSDLDITVNGDAWNPTLHGAPALATVLALAGSLFVAMLAVLLVVLVIVPVVLLLVLGAAALGIGAVLLALLLAAAVALSPLWLIGLAVWLVLRRKPVVLPNLGVNPAARMPA